MKSWRQGKFLFEKILSSKGQSDFLNGNNVTMASNSKALLEAADAARVRLYNRGSDAKRNKKVVSILKRRKQIREHKEMLRKIGLRVNLPELGPASASSARERLETQLDIIQKHKSTTRGLDSERISDNSGEIHEINFMIHYIDTWIGSRPGSKTARRKKK
ncbi:MAG: hypothetical protein HOE11_04390 [Candidatus Diapherotrites archaeon]|nr:hypothetical protein [Candidatus Diapherotrites archaeon]